ncbi:hypothetical protein [Zavarzinia aquatilis]|uniref:DUF4412 domain-containing protein n=1 Tax=Zavarzinia aquatilis TaxID=2211142 RepID=A0A317DUW6_9PROT|nr:hypothetical protein [Zavarzinia aquatilis]PWR18477.1 hypothetical protein DKG74_18825 [Zavarzinia aquatilis]
MRRFPSALLAAVAVFSPVAGAEARELLAPRVDYAATYVLQPDGETMRMAHHASKMRIDTSSDGEAATIIIDPAAQRMLMLMQGMVLQMDMRERMPGMSFKDSGASLATDISVKPQPLGTKVIAGLTCTVYDAICGAGTGEPVHSLVCLTPDNVMLESVSKDQGRTVTLTATAVEIGPQDPALFAAPPGAQVMDMSRMMGGMGAMPGQ